MQIVYTADNDAEAHMMAHMLEREDVPAHIQGKFLGGGAGELPTMGTVKIMVPDNEAKRAREIIEQWEKQSPKPRPIKNAAIKTNTDWNGRIAAFLFGCLCTWSILELLK